MIQRDQGLSKFGILLNKEFDNVFDFIKRYHLNYGKLYRFDQKNFREIIAEVNDKIKGELSPAELNGITIITSAIQIVLFKYWDAQTPTLPTQLNENLKNSFGSYHLDNLIKLFASNFPLKSAKTREELFYPELITTWLTNQNKAFSAYEAFFSDKNLAVDIPYYKIMDSLETYFNGTERLNKSGKNIIGLLKEPALQFPNSIEAQLNFIKDNWHDLPDEFLDLLLTGLDKFKEEKVFNWGGHGEQPALTFNFDDNEYERFSEDSDWMPRLVLIAKSTYVWLDQLSKKYQKSVTRLDEIPESELLELSNQGFTGIWFIGLWERSQASHRIKNMMGNSEAIASAYSLDDYSIAESLGGDEAMRHLMYKASKYNMRIGCDMVPNHTGIDSKWMKEHPEWYMQLSYQPYPNYSFNGENLSNDPEFSIHIEDHYFDKTDAAVVFKHYKHSNGKTRYIYHGNDGTGIPWNDTAQLNYLLPEVREALIQKIISIAKEFPIIRFDAAMTLAKKHIQRLWFPEPGLGGDIPTRSDFALTKAEFNQHMPEEFWREVVDRAAIEAPNTLLLAEAFWMMEGYFVRTLGMHRVYNSAFMHMLKDEENAKYRQSIFNIIEFNPQILKRFVNFMSNPDEETAIDQFGMDDKYFGVCVVMATMPGLPMFAHGQIEGFTEKYGMEFSKARMDEQVNKHLVARHQREIFPLLRKRIIFSEVENFLLFDFQSVYNYVDENVFAYSNNNMGQFSLVAYHNKYAEAKGYVKIAKSTRAADGKQEWFETNLSSAMGIDGDPDKFVLLDDMITGLTYIRKASEIKDKGLYLELGAFKYHVFTNLRIREDSNGELNKLCNHLNGKGTADISLSMKKIELQPFLKELEIYIDPKTLTSVLDFTKRHLSPTFMKEIDFRVESFIEFIAEFTGFEALNNEYPLSNPIAESFAFFQQREDLQYLATQIYLLEMIAFIKRSIAFPENNNWCEDYLVTETIKQFQAYQSPNLSILDQIIDFRNNFYSMDFNLAEAVVNLFKDKNTRDFLEVHKFEETLWFSKDKMNLFIDLISLITKAISPLTNFDKRDVNVQIRILNKATKESQYRYLDFMELLDKK